MEEEEDDSKKMVDFIPQKDTMQGTQAITTNLPEV
jgi:hypothetical protein